MQNFDYMTPTRLIFGRGAVDKLADAIRPYGKRVLLAYGGGSIKKSGLYDKVKSLLADCEVFELPGIQPNPKYDPSVLEGVRICKEIKGSNIICMVGRGIKSHIAFYEDEDKLVEKCSGCMKCVQACPVAALKENK